MSTADLSVFDGTDEYPNPEAKRRLEGLVGINTQRERLEKGLRLILEPGSVETWSHKHYKVVLEIVHMLQRRPPMFLLVGDVGTGKTTLAESVGDAVSRATGVSVMLYRMSLASRGTGLVGQMTSLISTAFGNVIEAARKTKGAVKHRGAHILLIDEADALAQTRESEQMHHEDRSGVNALIRGIDDLSGKGLPVAVIMCTNRLSAIDPAVRRRAAEILEFERPGEEQRRRILTEALTPVKFDHSQIEILVAATGENTNRPGFTYSDIVQRFLPTLVLEAFPNEPITFSRAVDLAAEIRPTPRFRESE